MKENKLVIIIIIIIILFFTIISIVLITNSVINNGKENPYNVSNFKRMGVPDAVDIPNFSPNGEQIIYLSNKYLPEQGSIWIMDVDGTNRTMLYINRSIDSSFTSPKFSPDGNKIIFTMTYINKQTDLRESSIDILIKNGTKWDNSNTHEKKFINRDEKYEGMLIEPSYGPFGKKITYRVYAGSLPMDGIWTMDVDGTNQTQLGNGARPSFNSDGSEIVYIDKKDDTETQKIWIMNADGSNKRRFTYDDWFYDYPSFTPDGRILFESERSSPHSSEISPENIWMMNADGSNQVLIVPSRFNNEVGSSDFAINPNGTIIFFTHGLYDHDLYYVVDQTGEWKDSDGDGVWDGIDGAPDDPDAGYIKDELFDEGVCGSILLPSSIMLIAVWGRWNLS